MAASSAMAALPSAGLGWLDGFCAAPSAEGGHACYRLAPDLYALVWPCEQQGRLEDVARRLLCVGQRGAVIPARYGQLLADERQLHGIALHRTLDLHAALSRFGLLRQFSAVLPLKGVETPQQATLRVKHQARRQMQKQLRAAETLLQPFVQQLGACADVLQPPQRVAADKAALHVCVPRDQVASVEQAWAGHGPRVSTKALIGPLPPFAFLPCAAAGHGAKARG